jgi:DNA-binding PadR family transcriptional regulator
MDDIRQLLPLTPQQFEILLSLVDGERHGYGIIREIERRTGGAVRLGTGTLYTAIARLEALELVAASDGRTAAPDRGHEPAMRPERRRYYRLTVLGGRVLQAETGRLDRLVRAARAKGISPPGRPAWSKLR